MSKRIIVVGHGMVGARFVEDVRRRDPGAQLVVIGAEPRPAYNRVLLSTVLAGGLSADAIEIPCAGAELRLGVTATAIDVAGRVLHTDDDALRYDELVLATGSRSFRPPLPGVEHGIGFRDLDDCAAIMARARPGAKVAVLGGGLLGCEAARGLAGRGVHVTLVHPAAHLMERQLDPGAGEVLAAAMGRIGVDVRLGVAADAWAQGAGLHLTDGVLVPADVLVVTAGVRAEAGLAAGAGIATDRGVLVDDRLRTSAPHVHAIGDCAQHAGAPAGLVQPGWEQAAVLADLLTGADPAARYRGSRAVTRLKARDIDLATVGDSLDAPEVLRFADPTGGRYASLALDGDRVVGGAMIGLPDAAASMIQLFDSGRPAPSDRLALLLGRALPGAPEAADPGRLPAAAVVCRCNTVTKGELVAAWRAGATTRAGTGCGGCGDTVAGIHGWLEGAA